MENKHPMTQQKISKLKIGEYEACAISTGIFGLDGGSMFGTVPKVLWEKAIPADENNRIPMEARALLLKSKDKNILIDCGNGQDFIAKYGEKLGSKFAEMYNIKKDGANLIGSLKSEGLEPKDITHVIFTHLHFDHCGGGVCEQNGELVPAFPNAQYFVQEANLNAAKNPNARERSSYFQSNFEPLIKRNVLTTFKGDTENILPGISVYVSNGHTEGQQVVKITDGKTTLLYCADLIPTSAHIRLPWIMGYDLHPLLMLEEKARFLGPAADEGWYLFFEHDPARAFGKAERHGHDFKCV
jgi:glyoxylase-like metal-dependent hydrolase (beta-lactamase superfamily II)